MTSESPGYVFPACVLDAWSRKVVGWSMRDDLRYIDGFHNLRRPQAEVSTETG